jgi:microcystin-dependent protein
LLAYPVGSVYQSAVSTSPADVLGGEWTQIKDRFLLAAGDTYANGSTGGEATHTLSINEIPSHEHAIQGYNNVTAGSGSNSYQLYCRALFPNDPQDSGKILATGGGQAHNNMPPYIAVYTWYRTN